MSTKTNYVAKGLKGLGVATIILGTAIAFPVFILGIPVMAVGFCIFVAGILVE